MPAAAGPFDPTVGRQTSVVVLTLKSKDGREGVDHRIVTTMSTRSTTEVLEIHSSSGALRFASEHTDEASALLSLRRDHFMEVARGSALLGYIATDTLAGVLLATKVVTKAVLPGGHAVNLVADARWELLPLEGDPAAASAAAEQEFWRWMQQNTVAGVHYFCETADLTRPFPSAYPASSPEKEFVWNAWLAQPLAALGLSGHCPALLQGAVEAVDEVHPKGQRFALALLSRRSRRHPGTRYIARGLNYLAGPGNEIEAEVVTWTPGVGGVGGASGSGARAGGETSRGPVRWARVAWRRGTVPIWWGVELQPLNKGLQAEVYVRDSGTYLGMLTYFRSLQQWSAREAGTSGGAGCSGRGTAAAAAGPAAGGGGDATVGTVTCVNLLHCNPKKAAELMLSSHFQEGMRLVREQLAATPTSPNASPLSTNSKEGSPEHQQQQQQRSQPVKPLLLNFDWHGTMGSLSEERGIEAFWHFIKEPVKRAGVAVGVMEPGAGGALPAAGGDADCTPWGAGGRWRMRWRQRQRGLLRFNCADSLDRTNAATCFAMLPAVQEGLRLLGIPIDVTVPDTGELPEGWERREHDGKALYVDHVNKITQWRKPPPLGPPWGFFSYDLEDVRSRLHSDTLADYVAMFKKHGDVHSSLYTGSPAMHSHVLGLILAVDARPYGASASVGRLQNLRVAVQRRWNNTVSDVARQQTMELFLGLNVARHCPGLRITTGATPLVDLSGLDEDDTPAMGGEEMTHLGPELGALRLVHHDGRLGLHEDIGNLEPLAPQGDDSSSSSSGQHRHQQTEALALSGDEEEDEEEEEEEEGYGALDPLGAVRASPERRKE